MNLLEAVQYPCGTNLDGTTAHLFLMLLNTLMGTQCSLGSKDYYPPDSSHTLQNNEEFDFIIAGAGSAGSVVANKLSENPNWKILVLEAGDYPTATTEVPSLIFNLQGTAEDWQIKTEPSETACKAFTDGQCRWPRGKVLGGSSSINAMLYVRGNARDYDEWEKLGNTGWSYKELERHFKQIENVKHEIFQETKVYGKGGNLNLSWYDNEEPISKGIVDGVKEMGHPIGTGVEQDPRNPLGYYQTLMTIDQGVRMSAAKALLGQAKHRENLVLVTKTFVKKILIDKKSLEAKGVEIEKDGKTLTMLARKEVILAGGSLGTPQILLHSGIGPKGDLEALGIKGVKDLTGVGKNLQDHVSVPLYFKVNETAFVETSTKDMVDNLYDYFKARKGPLATIHLTNLNGFINTKQDSQDPNIQMLHIAFRTGDSFLLPQVCKAFGYNAEIVNELLKNVNEESLISIEPILLNPKSTGSIKLRSRDVFAPAKFYSGYFTHPDDIKSLREGIEFVLRLVQTLPMQQYNPRLVQLPLPECKSDANTEGYWTCYIRHLAHPMYHEVGTAKMGPSNDEMAVVDERLRVYGIGKLRVIDASIMPKVTSGNTNAPALMIGHKGAEMIMEDWKSKERIISDEL